MATAQTALHVLVLGAGAWGSALAALAARRCPTSLWARDPAQLRQMQATQSNARYLPGIALPPELQFTSNVHAALAGQARRGGETLIILGVPVAGLAETCQRLAQALDAAQAPATSVIWTCKGLEAHSGRLPHAIVHEALAPLATAGLGLGVLSGPSFAHEVARGLPVALTIASAHAPTIGRATRALHGGTARIYSSPDIVGVEIGGALKNVMAIACGISDGLGLGDNARAALITRGLAELQRLGLKLGGQSATFYGLTGLGDLVLTATGSQSRNRQVGLAIGQGQTLEHILAGGMTAEGVRCVHAVRELARLHGLDLPIIQSVHQVLFEGLAPRQAVAGLLARDAGPEVQDAAAPLQAPPS